VHEISALEEELYCELNTFVLLLLFLMTQQIPVTSKLN